MELFTSLHTDKCGDGKYYWEWFPEQFGYTDGLLLSYAGHLRGEKIPLDRIPEGIPIMGDNGAFSYVDEEEPPYSIQEIIDYYESIGADRGVSIDHIIPDLSSVYDGFFPIPPPEDYQRRYDITLDFAERFLKECQTQKVRFAPIGAIQGWSPDSYKSAAAALVKMGYEYLSIGGVARLQNQTVEATIKAVRSAIPPTTKIHVLGALRGRLKGAFERYNVTSADGMGAFWKGVSRKVYLSKRRWEENCTLVVSKKDAHILDMLVSFQKGKVPYEGALEKLFEYDKTRSNEKNQQLHRETYPIILKARFWEECPCKVCRDKGILVHTHGHLMGYHNMYHQCLTLKTDSKSHL